MSATSRVPSFGIVSESDTYFPEFLFDTFLSSSGFFELAYERCARILHVVRHHPEPVESIDCKRVTGLVLTFVTVGMLVLDTERVLGQRSRSFTLETVLELLEIAGVQLLEETHVRFSFELIDGLLVILIHVFPFLFFDGHVLLLVSGKRHGKGRHITCRLVVLAFRDVLGHSNELLESSVRLAVIVRSHDLRQESFHGRPFLFGLVFGCPLGLYHFLQRPVEAFHDT